MFRPDWVALVVLYWVIALPHHLNVISAWVVGLIMDILLGSTLGIHALSMAVISWRGGGAISEASQLFCMAAGPGDGIIDLRWSVAELLG